MAMSVCEKMGGGGGEFLTFITKKLKMKEKCFYILKKHKLPKLKKFG